MKEREREREKRKRKRKKTKNKLRNTQWKQSSEGGGKQFPSGIQHEVVVGS